MARITDTTTKNLLTSPRIEFYDSVEIYGDWGEPFDGPIRITNYPIDLTIDDNLYLAFGALLSISDVTDTSEFEVNSIRITLGGINPRLSTDDNLIKMFQDSDWKDKDVSVYRTIINDPSDASTAKNVLIFKGRTFSTDINISDDMFAMVSVQCKNHFSEFDRVKGRHNNPSEAPRLLSRQYKDRSEISFTNLVGEFNDFSTWSLSGLTANTSTINVSPAKLLDGTDFLETTANTQHRVQTPLIDMVANTEYTFSFFHCHNTLSYDYRYFVEVDISNVDSGPIWDVYYSDSDPLNSYSSYFTFVSKAMVYDQPLTYLFNGWWTAHAVTFKAPSTGQRRFRISSWDGSSSPSSDTYAGNTSYGFTLFGAMCYEGAYNAQRSFHLLDFYDLIPDQLFARSAQTNRKITWNT